VHQVAGADLRVPRQPRERARVVSTHGGQNNTASASRRLRVARISTSARRLLAAERRGLGGRSCHAWSALREAGLLRPLPRGSRVRQKEAVRFAHDGLRL
jgi:hypothetical protein